MPDIVMFKKLLLTGGGATAVDGISATALVGGELCWACVSDVEYLYQMNATSGATADGVNIIIPVVGTVGDKRWILQGSYATTGVFTTAIADNTATTQAATTAFAKKEDAVLCNPKAPSQGVNMTAAASGSNGIAVAHDAKYTNTTNSCGYTIKRALPSWTPSANQIIYQKLTGGAGEQIEIVATTGVIRLTLNATVYNSAVPGGGAASNLVAGTEHQIDVDISVGASNTTVTFYVDGVLLSSPAAQANVDLTNTAVAYINGTSAVRTAGVVKDTLVWNRGRTAAEVLDLYRNGIAFADKWGSQTSKIAGWDFTLAWAGSNATINDANTFTFSGSGGIYKQGITTYVLGKKYRATIAGTRSTATAINLFAGAAGGESTFFSVASGSGAFSATGEITANANDVSSGGLYINGNSADAVVDITEFTVVPLGATLALEEEGIQPNPGQWLDSSSNKLHAWQPAVGSSLTRHKNTFEIRGRNTWAGTHEAQSIFWATDASQSILPVDCYITDIIGVITGATIEDIIIGDGSDTDRWVTITTGLAVGTVAFTVANRISDGTNYEMVVDPDANFTGTIEWTIKGIILE